MDAEDAEIFAWEADAKEVEEAENVVKCDNITRREAFLAGVQYQPVRNRGIDGLSLAEPAFKNGKMPTLAQLRLSRGKEKYASMIRWTAMWPLCSTGKIKRQVDGYDMEITASCLQGTNATYKTWATESAKGSHSPILCCAQFVWSQVSWHHHSRSLTVVLTSSSPVSRLTRFYITSFVEARRRGYPVAESNVPITVLTLEDFMSALDFLFREALVRGTTDGDKILPECQERTSKWKKKEGAEFKAKKLLLESPGTITGNPMHNDAVKRYNSAAEKDARQHGERSVTSAPVKWSMVQRL